MPDYLPPKQSRKAAFTLAEVLITVGIIGVVAALTIPTIMQNSNSKKFASQFKKTLSTLSQAAIMSQAQYDTDYSSLNTASSSESCAEESLAKSNLTMCGLLNSTLSGHTFLGMYGTVKGANAWSVYTVTRESLPKSSLGENTMIFALSDGSFVGFNKNATRCGVTPGTPINGNALGTALADCIGFIDVNGPNPPNKEITCKDSNANNSGSTCPPEKTVGDVFPVVFHDATVEPLNTDILTKTANGHKIGKRNDPSTWEAFVPTPITKAECEAMIGTDYGITGCYYNNDYWAAAVKECGGVDKIASDKDLYALAKTLYPEGSCQDNYYSEGVGYCSGRPNLSNLPEGLSGLGSSWYYLCSGSEHSSYNAYCRYFISSDSGRHYSHRANSASRAVCVSD